MREPGTCDNARRGHGYDRRNVPLSAISADVSLTIIAAPEIIVPDDFTSRRSRISSKWLSTRELRFSQSLEMPDRSSRCDCLRGGDNRIGINPVVAIKLSNRSGLAEMLDAERTYTVAADCPEPGEGCGMAVKHGDQAAMPGQVRKRALHM